EARKILDVSLHQRNLPVIARAKEARLRVRIAHERDDARAGGDQVFHKPKADHAGGTRHKDAAILPKSVGSCFHFQIFQGALPVFHAVLCTSNSYDVSM